MRGKKKILAIFSFFLVGVICIIPLFFLKRIPERKAQDRLVLKILLNGSESIESLWKGGDIDGLWKKGKMTCREELGANSNVNESFLKCNPNFLQCYFDYSEKSKNSPLRIKMENGDEYHIRAVRSYSPIKRYGPQKRFYRIITRSEEGHNIPGYAVEVELEIEEIPGKSLKILLEDSCHDVYLPERYYSMGPMPEEVSLDWRWDNFDRAIYVDRYQVTNRDVAEWMDFTSPSNRPDIKIPQDKNLWSRPATNLTSEQMEKFCMFKSKELLEAHVFDAATFKPGDYSNVRPLVNLRGPWPWTTKRKDSFIYEKRENPDFNITPAMCMKAYVGECPELLNWEAYNSWTPSWTGIFNVLGGYMEHFKNRVNHKKNLKASSFYFKSISSVHALGKRYFWDGKGFGKGNFDLGKEYREILVVPEELEVAFRCMKVVRHVSKKVD